METLSALIAICERKLTTDKRILKKDLQMICRDFTTLQATRTVTYTIYFRSTVAKFHPWPSARGPIEQLHTCSVGPYNSRMGRGPDQLYLRQQWGQKFAYSDSIYTHYNGGTYNLSHDTC